MPLTAGTQTSADRSTRSGNPGHGPGLLGEALLLGRELRSVAHGRLQLAALETRHAGESLVSIVIMGLVAAGLGLSAWLALLAAVLVALVQHGMLSASVALLLGVAVNVVLTALLLVVIRRTSRALLLSATVNSLKPDPSPPADIDKPE